MRRRTWNALRLFGLLQWRFHFVQVYLAIAALTVLALRLALPAGWGEWLIPVFLVAEPGMLGLTLVAAHAYLERSEGSVTALAVTPLGGGEHVLALVVASAGVATLAGALVWAGILGVDGRLIGLLPPLFLTAALSGFLGLGLSTCFSELTRFLLGALIPAVGLLSLPLASYFEVAPRAAFVWVPTDAALFAFANLTRAHPDAARALGYTALLCVYTALAFAWARQAFEQRVRQRLERA
ncbi:MAG: hypothetical protein ACE5IL_14160 [Myxococcota bacterium]